MATVLINPTVGDLIAELQKSPATAPVIIEDADTSWTIDHIHIHTDKTGRVVLWGEYPEMTG